MIYFEHKSNEMEDPAVKTCCTLLSSCGLIRDFKSIYQTGKDETPTVSKLQTVTIFLTRILFKLVGIFNNIMDIIFVTKIAESDDENSKYAILMFVVTVIGFLNEHFVAGPYISSQTEIIRDRKDAFVVMATCCLSMLASFWLEDVITILIYFVDEKLYDGDDVNDVTNLFSSIIAGVIAFITAIILLFLWVAQHFGVFNEYLPWNERFQGCRDSFKFLNPTRVGSAMIATLAVAGVIGPVYVGFFYVYLQRTPSDFFLMLLDDDGFLGFGFAFIAVLFLGGLITSFFVLQRFKACCTSPEQARRRFDNLDRDIDDWRDHPNFGRS